MVGNFTPKFCRDDDVLKMTPLEFLHLTTHTPKDPRMVYHICLHLP